MFMFNYFLMFLNYTVTIIFGSQDTNGSTWSWLEPTLSYLFSAFWVLPLIFLSRIVTALWFQVSEICLFFLKKKICNNLHFNVIRT